MNVIKTENLTLKYANNQVISNANFEIEEGEYIFVIGGNGAGKSTLVKALLGIIPVTKGQVILYGKKFSQKTVANNFAYVPQFTKIERNFPITVREIIKLECELSGKECHVDVNHHLKEFDAAKLIDKKLTDLSGGEFQKVMIARALVTHPNVIILDEPTNSLDEESSSKLRLMLLDLNKNHGKTIIVITHDHAELHAADHKQRVLLVQGGEVLEKDADKFFHQHL
jgi:zinc transport system ATP-binding protein